MRNFLRAILDEWEQHWRPLLFLFVVEALLFLVWIFVSEYARHNLWFRVEANFNEFCLLAIVILYCSVPVIMAPNLLTTSGASDNVEICCKVTCIDRLIVRWKFLCLPLPVAALYGLWLLITNSFQCWGINPLTAISCFVLLMLLGIVLAAWRISNFFMPCSKYGYYWTKFVAGLILFIFPVFGVSVVGLILNGLPSDRIFYEATIIVLSAVSGIYVLFFFIACMMPKTRRPIAFGVAILTTLLLLFLLTPGIIGGIALFSNDALIKNIIDNVTAFSLGGGYDGESGYIVFWATLAFFSTSVIVLPPLGYLLWTRKIITEQKYLNSLFFGTGLLVVASIVLCIIAVSTGASRLRHAEYGARSAGLLHESRQILSNPASVPVERNASHLYYKAYRILEKLNKRTENYHYSYYNLEYLQSPESRQSMIDFIQSPEGKQIHALIDQAAFYPECRFIAQIDRGGINMFAFEMGHLAHFLLAQAYVYKFSSQENKILPEIEKSLRIDERINFQQFNSSFRSSWRIIEYAMTDAIKIGTENPSSAASYRRILDYLSSRQINYTDNRFESVHDYFTRILTFQCCFDDGILKNSDFFSKALRWADSVAGHSLVLRHLADYIDINIEVMHKILKVREMPVLPRELNRLVNEHSFTFNNDYDRLLSINLSALFSARSLQKMLKIGLALKIYKCEHGKYPASLQELAPAILPEIPVDPLDGKPFGYSVKNGNFILTSKLNRRHELSSELKGVR